MDDPEKKTFPKREKYKLIYFDFFILFNTISM